jgi:DNA repair protein RadC
MALYQLKVSREKIAEDEPRYVSSADDVHSYFAEEMETYDIEHFNCLYLDNRNKVVGIAKLSQGTVNRSAAYPREVIKHAILTQATGIILMHNHPSNTPEPSPEDKNLTRTIVYAATTMQIKVLDHIIFAGDNYYSFQAHGQIEGYEADYIKLNIPGAA